MRYRNTPPFTSPLVLIALRLSVVMTQTTADIPIMTMVSRMPACATTHESRRNSMTPHMFNRHGIRTPWIHPNFIPPWPCWPTTLPACPVSTTLASWNSVYLKVQFCTARLLQFSVDQFSDDASKLHNYIILIVCMFIELTWIYVFWSNRLSHKHLHFHIEKIFKDTLSDN